MNVIIWLQFCTSAENFGATTFQTAKKRQQVFPVVIIYMQKFQHADWLRACQLIPNSAKTWNFLSAEKTKLAQKLEFKLIYRKVAKDKLTDGQSNLLFSNQAYALDSAIHGAIFPWLRDTRAFPLLNHLKFFQQSAWRNFFMYIINR